MSDKKIEGMSVQAALRLEFAVIGLGVLALLMIFQPFSLVIFSIGCGLVVLAALANNLLPLAEPGTPMRMIVFAATVVALIFCTALIVAIIAAYLYGLAFLNPPPAGSSLVPSAPPFWTHPLVWTLVVLDAVLWVLVFRLAKGN